MTTACSPVPGYAELASMVDRLCTRALYRRAVQVVMEDRVGGPEQRNAQLATAGIVAHSSIPHLSQMRDPLTGRRMNP